VSDCRVNEGENSVFPIQVSHRELLLFLECCYFYGAYKNIVYADAQALFGNKITSSWEILRAEYTLA
jgi:hypothetical protein